MPEDKDMQCVCRCVATVFIFLFLTIGICTSYGTYLSHKTQTEAMKAGYEQKIEGLKLIWTKTNIEKAEQ